MLGIFFLALAVIGFQVNAEPAPQGYLPNPNSYQCKCPNFFPIVPYHFFCYCNFDYCLDPYIESQAEILAANTQGLTLCQIQQLFILVENIVDCIDYETEIAIVSAIVYALETEIINGGYCPTEPPLYCTEFSDLDIFSPSSMFSSEAALRFYDARFSYFLSKTMPYLTEQFYMAVKQAIYTNLNGRVQYQYFAEELFYKMHICLRSILSNMIDTTPPVNYM